MRGRAAPPHPRIYRVPPPPPRRITSFAAKNRFIWRRKDTSVKAKILRYGLELTFCDLTDGGFSEVFLKKRAVENRRKMVKGCYCQVSVLVPFHFFALLEFVWGTF